MSKKDPDGMNAQRVGWADEALNTFAGATGLDPEVEPNEMVGDLLANIMHWCADADIDFDARLETARMHYEAETGQ